MNTRRATMFRQAEPLRRMAPRWRAVSFNWKKSLRRTLAFNKNGALGGSTHVRTLTPYAAALGVIVSLAMLLAYGARRVVPAVGVGVADSGSALAIAHEPRGETSRPRSPSNGARGVVGARANARAASGPAVPGAAIGVGLPPAIEDLRRRSLSLPVNGVRAEQLVPTFDEARGDRPHEAIDIMAPRGTPVVATEDGRIARLFWSKAGGHTIYQFDPSEHYVYYYAHLDRYADGLAEGQAITRGQTIGYVGSTGNAKADAPHLHFAIFLLTPEKRWWDGAALDPFPVLRWNIDGGTP
jgi:murein DD-endopeptidase MepM/ murein hydrolase activator NlpD